MWYSSTLGLLGLAPSRASFVLVFIIFPPGESIAVFSYVRSFLSLRRFGGVSPNITGDHYGLGRTRTLASFEERIGVDFRTATVTSPDARNAGRPATDFNDSIASGLEGVLKILKIDADVSNGYDASTAVGPSEDETVTGTTTR